jgi:hypothetical protein
MHCFNREQMTFPAMWSWTGFDGSLEIMGRCALCMHRYDAARWMMTYLGMKFLTKFAKAALMIGMPIHGKKMSAEQAFAMWSDANINTTQQRIVNQHFAAFYGHMQVYCSGT